MCFKVLFMTENQTSLNDLHHIRSMMERSSRFISLSGLSGISAGICALIGAYVAHPYVFGQKNLFTDNKALLLLAANDGGWAILFFTYLFWIALATLIAALGFAFLFTYLKARKQKQRIWGASSRRLFFSVMIPLVAGGLLLLKAALLGATGVFAAGCLIVYGIALLNGSKYTLGEIRYLALSQIALGVINLFMPAGLGLYFWAFGFGVLHILYGIIMWNKYDRHNIEA